MSIHDISALRDDGCPLPPRGLARFRRGQHAHTRANHANAQKEHHQRTSKRPSARVRARRASFVANAQVFTLDRVGVFTLVAGLPEYGPRGRSGVRIMGCTVRRHVDAASDVNGLVIGNSTLRGGKQLDRPAKLIGLQGQQTQDGRNSCQQVAQTVRAVQDRPIPRAEPPNGAGWRECLVAIALFRRACWVSIVLAVGPKGQTDHAKPSKYTKLRITVSLQLGMPSALAITSPLGHRCASRPAASPNGARVGVQFVFIAAHRLAD